MTPKTLHFGAFSPTGGTRRVMRALITGTPREGFAIRDFEFTLPEERRMRRFTEEDAVVLCAPVYYGRIPTPLQTKLPFEGNGARALAVVSYGNRAYEDALREWRDVLERHGFKVTTLDYLDGDEAGLKSASIMVEGENAYGYLKGEAGVHRLVRVSPFDAAGRRHTSFSSLEVMPEMELDNTVEIPPEDIKMEVYRASGAGGQKVNKTSSAVRLIHIPTGITVSCQVERSQFQNREVAMKMLVAKLMEIKERENLEKISDIKGEQKEITWGSQIRSYVFMPYTMVKDHRTGFETGNVNAVMDGDLDGFINAYLTALSQGTLGAAKE